MNIQREEKGTYYIKHGIIHTTLTHLKCLMRKVEFSPLFWGKICMIPELNHVIQCIQV